MGTWDKDYAVVFLYDSTTGEWDTTPHTVKFQPIDQAYDTGAITTTRLSCDYAYKPDSDLDDQKHYDIYVDDVCVRRAISPKSIPNIGV